MHVHTLVGAQGNVCSMLYDFSHMIPPQHHQYHKTRVSWAHSSWSHANNVSYAANSLLASCATLRFVEYGILSELQFLLN